MNETETINWLADEIIRLSAPLPDPEAHARWLRQLQPRSLQERLDIIRVQNGGTHYDRRNEKPSASNTSAND